MDTFETGAWVNGPAPVINEYVSEDDRIVVNYDESVTPDPLLEVNSVTDGGETYASITLNGTEVVRVILYGGDPAPDVSDIALVASNW